MKRFILIVVCFFLLTPAMAKTDLSKESRAILHAKCMDCHASGIKQPWYAQLPLVKTLVKEDVEKGIEDFDIRSEIDAKKDSEIDMGTLLHLEVVLTDKTMPPIQYGIIHWDKYLNQNEIQTLLAWLKTLE